MQIRYFTGVAVVVAMACIAPSHSDAQGIARRISAVRDGKVRMTFAARPEICGWGNGISTRSSSDRTNFRSDSKYGGEDVEYDNDCSDGPVRTVITMDDGRITRIKSYVGGRWRSNSGVTDLGAVPVREAVEYFLGLANTMSGKPAGEAIFATTLADSVQVAQPLFSIAKNESRPDDLREKAIFWLGQQRAPEGGQYLRSLYPRVSDPGIKDKIIFSISQQRDDESAKWLVGLAGNQSESMELRKKALFWAGQTGESLDRLVSMYGRMQEREMKEQMIFVFSQRHERAALDKLMDIAKNDPDRSLRKKAMFWLGQSRDERVTAFLSDIVSR
jgi:hypothetical protein